MRGRGRLFGAALVLALPGSAIAADQTWTVQTATSAGDVAFAITQDFADSIEVLTGGRLGIRLIPVGAVVQYSETLDAVAAGILDGHITATVYFSGKDPGFALLGDLIAAYEHPDQMLAFMHLGGGDELLRDLYARHGVHYIGGATTGKEAFVSKIPILGIHFALVSPTFGFRGCDDRRLGPCRGPARAAPPAGAVGRKAPRACERRRLNRKVNSSR